MYKNKEKKKVESVIGSSGCSALYDSSCTAAELHAEEGPAGYVRSV